MNNGTEPHPTGGTHWIEFLPDHVYCFLPSFDVDKGEVEVHQNSPEFLDNFLYSNEILIAKLAQTSEMNDKREKKMDLPKKWNENAKRKGDPKLFFKFDSFSSNTFKFEIPAKSTERYTSKKSKKENEDKVEMCKAGIGYVKTLKKVMRYNWSDFTSFNKFSVLETNEEMLIEEENTLETEESNDEIKNKKTGNVKLQPKMKKKKIQTKRNKRKVNLPNSSEELNISPSSSLSDGEPIGNDQAWKEEDCKNLTQNYNLNYNSRCKTCFISHFPRPNTKLCKFNQKFKQDFAGSSQYRLRGGAMPERYDTSWNQSLDKVER